MELSLENLVLNVRDIDVGIPNLETFECHLDDLNHLENGRPIKCPVTLTLSEGEELIAKYKGRVAGILLKEGAFFKVKRKFNT